MHPLLEGYLERPNSHKFGLWAVVIAIPALLFFLNFYQGKAEKLTKLNDKQDSLESELYTQRMLARKLPRVSEEIERLEAKLKKALQELPDRKQIPDLLSAVSKLAKDAGLEVSLFEPRGENFRDFYAEVPVSVSVTGTYHQVATFFDEVGRLERIVNINGISLKSPQITPEKVMVQTQCLATTFRQLDADELRQAREEESQGRRRR